MPIFEYNGKKYNVRDEHIDSFMKDFPDASTIMEREGKKYPCKVGRLQDFHVGATTARTICPGLYT